MEMVFNFAESDSGITIPVNKYVVPPTIVNPATGVTVQTVPALFTVSDFTPSKDAETLAATEWQVSSDAEFENILSESVAPGVNLKNLSVNILRLQTVYVRARFVNDLGWVSAWSRAVNVTYIPVEKPVQPSIISPANNSMFSEPNISFASSNFTGTAPGDTLALVEWEYSTDPTFNQKTLVTTGIDRSLTIANTGDETPLVSGRIIYVRVRYTGAEGWTSDWSTPIATKYEADEVVFEEYIAEKNIAAVVPEEADYWRTTGQLIQKIVAAGAANQDYFGWPVKFSVNGEYFYSSAYYDDDKGENSGSVFVYKRGTNGQYSQVQKLTASDGAAGAGFGSSLSVTDNGSVLAIGAYQADSLAGSVYVFRLNGTSYIQQQKLTFSTRTAGDGFGYSISVSDDGLTLAACAFSENYQYTKGGAVFIYTRTAITSNFGTTPFRLDPPSYGHGDYFGFSTSLSGNGQVLLIQNYGGYNYIYTRSGNNWTLLQTIVLPSDGNVQYFGNTTTVSKDGRFLVMGSPAEDNSRGAVYIYIRQPAGTYSLSQKLVAKERESGASFGYCVSMSGDSGVLVIGATGNRNSGSVYVFGKSETTDRFYETAILSPTDATYQDSFGGSVTVSVDGYRIGVGAFYHSPNFIDNAGAAYIYS